MAQERKKANGKLKELLKGPWPSFVKEIEAAAQKSAMSGDLLGLLERSYEDRVGHWKHGGIVGVRGYGGGVIGRYSDLPEEFPECVAVSHAARESAGGLVLHERKDAQDLRHLGKARFGADQHARIDRRSYPARHRDR